jgi:hypothetical protein
MIELKKGVNKFIDFYNEERFHSSLNYESPDSVYFGTNITKINSFCKFDKEFLLKSLIWMFVYSKQISEKLTITESA